MQPQVCKLFNEVITFTSTWFLLLLSESTESTIVSVTVSQIVLIGTVVGELVTSIN